MFHFKTLEQDRNYLENKFHDTSKPFNPFERMNYNGYDYDPATGLSTAEIKEGLKRVAQEQAGLSHEVQKARAIEYVLQNSRIDLSEHDYFAGIYTWAREIVETTMYLWKREVFQKILPQTGEEMERFNLTGAVTIWPDFDHVVPDWASLMDLGFPGIRERARRYRAYHAAKAPLTEEQKAYFDGIEIQYTAILDFLQRLADYSATRKGQKAALTAASLQRLHDGPPMTFFDALQLIYWYFMISESVDCYQVRSLGNGLDHTLWPFFERDLATGKATMDELGEYLGYFLMQWSAIGNYWGQPFYLGGTKGDGSSMVNQLTYLILDVYEALGIYNPKIQLKINSNSPTEFLDRALEMVRKSNTNFVFCCEPGMMQAILNYGATLEEARTFDIRGCYETGVRANEASTSTGYVNVLKAVEYAFHDGWDKTVEIQMGPHTGELASMKTFEDFCQAVWKHLDYFVDSSVEMSLAFEKYMGYVNPSSMYSATVTSSLENGRDGYQSGLKFNNSAMLCCGFGTLVDAMMAVKQLVFEKKSITLEELGKALDANWEGYELLRAKAMALPQKYGNGNADANALAKRIADWFTSKVDNKPNARGGVYKAIMHSALQFIRQGQQTLATPDGRRAGEEISKNASPTNGMDRNGVTALINSALNLTPSNFMESFCLDVMLHPSSVQGADGLKALRGLLMTYLAGGGMSIQFNVFQPETLLEAQAHPEKYRNLQVRVCGWNVRWNDLSKDEQDAYILRARNIAE